MDNKRYLKNILLFIIFFLLATAITNYMVDPEGIYSKKNSNSQIYINKLLESDYGLSDSGNPWNDREFKKALAEYPINYDCAIVGSSHLQPISSIRQNKSLVSICPSMKNLYVSGGTLEDYLAMSNIILKNKDFLPKTIVFGIDPWSLNFGRDKRWVLYAHDYFEMRDKLLGKPSSKNDGINLSKDLLTNLFNLQYLKLSLIRIFEDKSGTITPNLVEKFNYQTGLKFPVILQDGSGVYSSQFIEDHKDRLKTLSGEHSYKIFKDSYYQEYAIEIFEKLVQHLINSQVNVVFVLTPYRHKVLSNTEQPITKALNIIEGKVHEIAKKYKTQVIGTYNPYSIGCLEDEFFDNMHPMDKCLMKLENKSISY